MKKIGTLKKIELRDIWSREDTDFSKWLINNLNVLGEQIGLDLDVEEPELEHLLDDSKFRIDIFITNDQQKGEKIVIENQLERTDHKHLGQTMTYMIDKEAKIAIWIAKEVREKHRKVVDWLNESTDRNFYLIQLKGYQIDGSKPAPFFNVICRPSKEKEQTNNKKGSEADELKKAFWKKLLDNSKGKTDFFSKTSTSRLTVIRHNIEEDIRLAYYINKDKGGIAVRFSPDLRAYFLNLKKDLESKLGFDLKFEEGGTTKKSKRDHLIKWFDKGGWRNQENEWDQIQEEMITNMIELGKLVKSALKVKSSDKVA